ncbi:MAG TPA: fibronectin type III domain-containing protein [Solirubrobacteraceae bacterium]|nr:fibronectin type III domain-containing protein [Solirubrobacteraceae bacterium]
MAGGRADARELRRWGALLLTVGIALLVVLSLATRASAETIAVANLNDSGPGSLREAIAKAAVNDTITVPAGQITLTSGPLAFEKNLTIAGAGSGATTISGNDASRVFTIAGTPQVTLRGLTITHGSSVDGAGIKASGEVTLQDVVVRGNRAGTPTEDGAGGGIELAAGTYRLIESSVSENTARGGAENVGFGGGIEYTPSANAQTLTLTLTRSHVDGNHAGGGSEEASGFGAGIDASSGFDKGAITISLIESTLTGNVAGGAGIEASGFGGGLELGSGGAENALALTVERSSITGNVAGGGAKEASGFGGGIDYGSGGAGVTQALNVSNSTISANTAGGSGVEADGFGGGLEFGSGTGSLSHVTISGNTAGGGGGTPFGGGVSIGSLTGGVEDTIIAANSGGDCDKALVSNGNNIDGDSTCGFKSPGDKSGTEAKLGPVGDHGGPTLTQMPLAGSPAIDTGDPATCPATDQRGVGRPQGGGCDVGAVEVPPPVATTSSVASVSSSSASIAASVNPNFSATTYHFDFGTTTAYGSFTAAASAGEGGVAQAVAATLTGLKPETTYHFRVVATNAAGSVVGADQTLTTAKAPPAKAPPKKGKAAQPLRMTGVKMSNRRFRVGRSATAISARRRAPVGTSFRFRLSATARVQIAITRTAPGLRRGRSCVAPSRKLRQAHAKRCTRTLTVGKLTRSNVRSGTHAIAFSGRIGTKALKPRSYQAVLTASGAGKRSTPVVLSFIVVR